MDQSKTGSDFWPFLGQDKLFVKSVGLKIYPHINYAVDTAHGVLQKQKFQLTSSGTVLQDGQ